jgi:phosphoribosylformylglycinamidine synthase
MVLRYFVGATITLGNVGIELLSESPGRVVVAVNAGTSQALSELATKYSITLSKLGSTGGDSLIINDCIIPLSELRTAHTSTFPTLFG